VAKDFEILPHTADLKIRVYGTTMSDLFRNALIGMFQSIGPRSDICVRKRERVECEQLPIEQGVEVQSHDLESLLVDFLSQALYLSDVYNEAYLDADIYELNNNRIRATIKGVPITGFDNVEIKSVTYHDLRIQQIDGVWQTDIVFDI